MTKVTEKQDIRVEVTARSPFWGRFKEQAEIDACEEMVEQIKRHVDGVGDVRVTWNDVGLCAGCGAKWTEDGDTYNGGCCDEDEKNNPNPEPSE